mmetsp:Transcript_114561/g.334969  ORF Transcript_114561/g.334969 Transcript_114561/m.334969 type:complete len:207 (-) Transcript_114561:356-976(-)
MARLQRRFLQRERRSMSGSLTGTKICYSRHACLSPVRRCRRVTNLPRTRTSISGRSSGSACTSRRSWTWRSRRSRGGGGSVKATSTAACWRSSTYRRCRRSSATVRSGPRTWQRPSGSCGSAARRPGAWRPPGRRRSTSRARRGRSTSGGRGRRPRRWRRRTSSASTTSLLQSWMRSLKCTIPSKTGVLPWRVRMALAPSKCTQRG